MTLATVPRYDPGQTVEAGGHAVVVGASIAGLCAARVLSDAFERVTVFDRDPLPDEAVARRGVPQAQHAHVLLEAGRATFEDLFPGFGEDLLAAGAVTHDGARDADFHMEGGFLADGPRRRPVYSATRPLYEQVVRRRVAALDGVRLRGECQVSDYLAGDDATVEGVRVRSGDDDESVAADLVVDATGRTSRTPEWLHEHGYAAPPTDEVHVDVAYTTTFVERPSGTRHGITVVPSPDRPRGGAVLPVEGDRWQMTLWGMNGEVPPTDPGGIREWAASLPVPDLERLLEEHRRRGEVAHYPFRSDLRHRYENLDRFPDGLLVLGDAVASFNPIHGQGMSVAALEAVELHHALAAVGLEALPRRFFDRIEGTVDIAWKMAVGGDHRFPGTEGPKPAGTHLLNRYLSRLLRKAHTDGELFDAFFRVQMMEKPPTSLLRPGIAWRVLRPSSREVTAPARTVAHALASRVR